MAHRRTHDRKCSRCGRSFTTLLPFRRLCAPCWARAEQDEALALAEEAWEAGARFGYEKGVSDARRVAL